MRPVTIYIPPPANDDRWEPAHYARALAFAFFAGFRGCFHAVGAAVTLEYTKGWRDGYDAASMSGADKRSYPQLKRFMALMQAAFDHWPEGNPFRPDDKEHLRAYLIVRAGFMESVSIRVATWNMKPAEKDYLEFILRSAIKASGSHAFYAAPSRRPGLTPSLTSTAAKRSCAAPSRSPTRRRTRSPAISSRRSTS